MSAVELLTEPKFKSPIVRAQRLFLGLYVVALATTMSGMEIFSTALTLTLVLFVLFLKPRPSSPLPFLAPMLVFVAIAILGILLGGAPPGEKFYDFGRMRFFVLYAVLFYTLRFCARDFPWLKILLGVTLIIGAYGFVQHFIAIDLVRPAGKKILMYAIESEKLGPLVLGTFNHHLTFSNVYLFYACLFTSIGIFYFPKRPYILALGLLIYLLCAWTQSRVAWVAIPVTIVCVAWAKSRKLAFLSLCAVLAAMTVFYFTDPAFRERFRRTLFEQNDFYNLGPRKRLWAAQLYFFRESPLLGVGWNNNERRAKEVVDRLFPDIKEQFYGHAHSTFLQILSTTGLIGFAAYLWIWGAVFQRCLRVIRNRPRDQLEHWIAVGLFAGFVGFQIQGLTQWNFGDAEVIHNVVFFWWCSPPWIPCL